MDRTDRDYDVDDVISNVRCPATVPEFDTALTEFLYGLDDETFELIFNEINPLIFNSLGASTVDRIFIPCLPNGDSVTPEGHWRAYVLIGGGFMERSPKGRVGEIAHEFAHLVEGYKGDDPYWSGGPAAEAAADELAHQWGFGEEIDELNADGNGPHTRAG